MLDNIKRKLEVLNSRRRCAECTAAERYERATGADRPVSELAAESRARTAKVPRLIWDEYGKQHAAEEK